MGKHCNAYGFLGTFAAVCSAICWGLVQNKGKECMNPNYDTLQNYHIICIVVGLVVAVSSLLAVATFLYDTHPILCMAGAISIACAGGLAGYAAFFSFSRPCMKALGFIPFDSGLGLNDNRNVFNAEDPQMIGVFILNIVSCLCFISAAGNFSRRT